MAVIYNQQKLKERRRILRRNQTLTEKIIWEYLRGSKLGVRFVRQFSVGNYIVDFYAPSRRLVIEIDGSIHNVTDIQLNDEVRQKDLEGLGLVVLRFTTDEITGNIKDVIMKISLSLQNPLLTKERAG